MASLPKVLITIIHQGWVRADMLSFVANISKDKRAEIAIVPINQRPYENALNTAAQLCLKGECDYLITFDHDNVPTRNPIDLIFLEKDIIGMPYPTYRYGKELELAFLAMDKKEDGYLDHKNTVGLQEVDAVASGAMVISRPVLNKIFFERVWDKGFAIVGVDFNFCAKAKQEGFKVFAHYDYPAAHYKELNLLDII